MPTMNPFSGQKCLRVTESAPLFLAAVLFVGLLGAPGALAAGKEKILYRFRGSPDGGYPLAGLISDSKGILYGTTSGGGAYGAGTVFQLVPNRKGKWVEKVLYSFRNDTDANSPGSGLIFDSNGNLYGTTAIGGVDGEGAVFELSPGADGKWNEKVLYSFTNGRDGSQPWAGLALDALGNLYGTVYSGVNLGCGQFGGDGCGGVFELTPGANGTWTETVIHGFGVSQGDGTTPMSSVVFDSSGNLYGTTSIGGNLQSNGRPGCGVVFELTPSDNGTWTETILHTFVGKDGCSPWASVVFDAAGNLYGTTSHGGAHGSGTVFELMPSGKSWTENVLHSFKGKPNDGAIPVAAVILDAAGSLYGTTVQGGPYRCGMQDCGTAFRLTPGSKGTWTETVLHEYGSGADGADPWGPLWMDGAGNLYGTTEWGGKGQSCQDQAGCGTVFELSPK